LHEEKTAHHDVSEDVKSFDATCNILLNSTSRDTGVAKLCSEKRTHSFTHVSDASIPYNVWRRNDRYVQNENTV